MPTPRIYQAIPLKVNETIKLDREATHHLIHVLRLTVNDSVILFNGRGGEFLGEIVLIGKNEAQITLKKFNEIEREPSSHIHLLPCIINAQNMDFLIQKAVEIGVSHITPLISERSQFKLTKDHIAKRSDHWGKIIVNACEQCGRNQLPQLDAPINMVSVLQQIKEECKLILDPLSSTTFSQIQNRSSSVAILIGPEGGWSGEEIQLAETASFQRVQLGPRILRTETAAIAIMAMILSYEID
jgi:16S rRNA (uracil1498-N3)-methyltransferase